jgi:hypothetical protein
VCWCLAWVDGPGTAQCHRACNAHRDDDQAPSPKLLGDKAVGIADRLADRAIIAQILGIEPRRQRGRTEKIAEHERQLPPFGDGLNRSGYGSQNRR